MPGGEGGARCGAGGKRAHALKGCASHALPASSCGQMQCPASPTPCSPDALQQAFAGKGACVQDGEVWGTSQVRCAPADIMLHRPALGSFWCSRPAAAGRSGACACHAAAFCTRSVTTTMHARTARAGGGPCGRVCAADGGTPAGRGRVCGPHFPCAPRRTLIYRPRAPPPEWQGTTCRLLSRTSRA